MVALPRDILLRCLVLVFRPAVRFAVRHGLRIQDIGECIKVSLVSIAREELGRLGEKQNVSRISAMTGVHRSEVERITEQDGIDESLSRDLVTKVIGLWSEGKEWVTTRGVPRVLSAHSNTSEFAQLVEQVSTDLNAGTVLFELERLGAVEQVRNGVRLKAKAHHPKGDVLAGFSILSDDADDLVHAVEENVIHSPRIPHFHARTVYDNVRPDALRDIKRWLLREGYRFHDKVREMISKHDQDIHPRKDFSGKGKRVVFGAFSYVDEDEE